MDIELKNAEKSDEKILAKLFCEMLESPPSPNWAKHLLYFSFVRKWALRSFSESILEHWDKLRFWLILIDNNAAGFTMVSWRETSETDNRIATIHEIYLQPKFRGHGIETQVVDFVLNFSIENKLRLGFPVKPEWNLKEKL